MLDLTWRGSLWVSVFTMLLQAWFILELATTVAHVLLCAAHTMHGPDVAQHGVAPLHQFGAHRTHVHDLATHLHCFHSLQLNALGIESRVLTAIYNKYLDYVFESFQRHLINVFALQSGFIQGVLFDNAASGLIYTCRRGRSGTCTCEACSHRARSLMWLSMWWRHLNSFAHTGHTCMSCPPTCTVPKVCKQQYKALRFEGLEHLYNITVGIQALWLVAALRH